MTENDKEVHLQAEVGTEEKQNKSRKQYFTQIHKNYLEARKKIASMEAQINMHRLREESLIGELAELRKNYETREARFEEERREWMRDIRAVQESFQNAGNGKAEEREMLMTQIAEMKSALEDAERTRLFLLEESGKIKRQKAKLRCDFNDLKRKYSELLCSLPAETPSRNGEELSDASAKENIQSSNGQMLADGAAVLGLSQTHNVYIPPVSPAKCSNDNIVEPKVNLGSPGAALINAQESAGTRNGSAEDKKLIEELTGKLKQSDERNIELRKALHIVDEQSDKLVELNLRFERKTRVLCSLMSGTAASQGGDSSQGRPDTVSEHRTVEKNRVLPLPKRFVSESSDWSASKRKCSPRLGLGTFGKRPRSDPGEPEE